MADLRVLIACEFSGVVRREVDGFPGYEIASDGIVWSRRTSRGMRREFRAMTGRRDAKGYWGVILCAEGYRRRSVRIHRLVAEAFIPNPEGLPCVRHMDGDPSNNNASNLAWGTYADNEDDKIRHGTWPSRYGGARLSAEDRKLIRQLRAKGMTMGAIAQRVGVSRPSVSRLLSGATWSSPHA